MTTLTSEESEQIIPFLLETPLFEKLDLSELLNIIHIIESIEFPEGATIFNEGDSGDAWYVVYKGTLNVVNDDEKVGCIREKGCFGEMSILDNLPRSATISAARDSVLLRVNSEPFNELLQQHNLVAYKLIHQMAILLSERQRHTTQVLSELIKDTNVEHVYSEIRSLVGDSTVME